MTARVIPVVFHFLTHYRRFNLHAATMFPKIPSFREMLVLHMHDFG